MSKGRVLIVDDEAEMCSLLKATLEPRGYECSSTTSAGEALRRVGTEEYDAILTDLVMPEVDGVELCNQIAASCPGVPVVIMTAFGSMDVVVEAIRAGAFDFVTKPLEMEFLALVLQRAIDHRRLLEKVRLLSNPVETSDGFPELLGESRAMNQTKQHISQVGPTDASVLITGESGTGKELVARAICADSRRSDKPFVVVDCAALPAALMESELFGHERGAFTGALSASKGLFREAHGGTLFLDEIGELPLELQPKLLRAIEDRRIRPVGGTQTSSVDVRIIAATNRDLAEAVEKQSFRKDLYYRIQVVEIELPPLRERGPDAIILARHFVGRFAASFNKEVVGLSKGAAARIIDYPWPGNVRELRNAMERAVALTRHEKIAALDLPETVRRRGSVMRSRGASARQGLMTLAELERRYIFEVLHLLGDSKSETARVLGLDRKTLYRKLKSYETAAGGS